MMTDTVTTQNPTFRIQCAFAPDAKTQLHQTIEVAVGASIRQAIERLGWFEQYPQIQDYDVGIFAHKVSWETVIQKGDRIEIYRPLAIDPIKRRALKRRRRHAKNWPQSILAWHWKCRIIARYAQRYPLGQSRFWHTVGRYGYLVCQHLWRPYPR